MIFIKPYKLLFPNSMYSFYVSISHISMPYRFYPTAGLIFNCPFFHPYLEINLLPQKKMKVKYPHCIAECSVIFTPLYPNFQNPLHFLTTSRKSHTIHPKLYHFNLINLSRYAVSERLLPFSHITCICPISSTSSTNPRSPSGI